MKCKRSDCFNCPYPDCINEYFPKERTEEQRKQYWVNRKAKIQECRESGICTVCQHRPADEGYRTCAICRSKRNVRMKKYNHETGRSKPRELFDGVTLCKLCGKNPPADGLKVCEECRRKSIENKHKPIGGHNVANGFAKAQTDYWQYWQNRRKNDK